jgi:alkylation response protein AidB-like acyl-CoA dehydrogenase
MKLHWSELDINLHETALEILGADAETEMANGQWMKAYLFGLANPIWGGTSEIQRNIVAERILGLPRK